MKTLQQKAIERQKTIELKRKDARFKRVAGRLVFEGLLVANDVTPTRAHPTVVDALWAGEEVEPRILELLPAILLRRPKLFMHFGDLPEDLTQVVQDLRRGRLPEVFRGVQPTKLVYWAEHLGRSGKKLAIPKTHRFNENDLRAIETLKKRWDVDETGAIRKALEIAAAEG